MWDIWTTLDTQFQKQVTITAERANITYACYTILFNAVCRYSIKAIMMMMMTIQHEGGRRIDFWQSLYLRGKLWLISAKRLSATCSWER